MNRILAIAGRILQQFIHDKRTLMLLFIAPILVLWLLTVLLGTSSYEPKIVADDLPEGYVKELENQDATIVEMEQKEAAVMLKNAEIDAILTLPEGSSTLNINLEGSDRFHNAAVLSVVADATADFSDKARTAMQKDIDEKKAEIEAKKEKIEAKKAEIEQKKVEAKSRQEEIKAKIAKANSAAKANRKAAEKKQKKAFKSLQEAVSDLPPEKQKQILSVFSGLKTDTKGISELIDSIDTDSLAMDDFSIDTSDFDIDMDMDMDVDRYMPIQDTEKTYLHGSDDWEMFDFYGPIFIVLFIFVFTFLTSGMSLVNERSTGTMDRFLLTPVKSWQILGGYGLGFGAMACVQVAVIVTASLKFIGFPNEGNVGFIVLIAVSMAVASVTFGLLVSGLARNAFQVIQLMIVFVTPQILLCGLFDLSGGPGWLQALAKCLPLGYGVNAMESVMLRGSGFSIIWRDLAVVWGFIAGFFILAALGFRKKVAKKHGQVQIPKSA